jgi:deazaflavin-dependent oxidoreductase (nitroreductase family)
MAEQRESSSIPSFFNRLMSGLLRSPLHRIASRSVMLITFTGRKTGKKYTTPISYARHGDRVIAFTGANWSRNLVGGAPVTLNIKNKDYQGTATVIEESEAVGEALHAFLNEVRTDARFYKVGFDEDGRPNWEDVRRAAQRTVLLQINLNGA